MKNSKRFLSILICMVLLSGLLLSGCSKEAKEGDSTNTSTDATVDQTTGDQKAEDENVATEKIKLRLMTISTDENRTKIMEEFIKPNIEAAFPNVEVTFEPGGGGEDYANKIKTYNSAGDLPDVWYSTAAEATPIMEAGNMLDLTPYITEDGFINKYKIPEAIKHSDGKVYSLSSGCDSYFTPRIFYNKQIFADNNIEIPKTFDELLAVCEQLKAKNIIPITTPGKGGWAPTLFLFQTMVMVEDPNVVNDLVLNKTDFSNPVVKNALGRIEQLAKAGAFPEGEAGLDYGPAKELFVTDKAAMYMMFTWELPELAKNPNYDFFSWPSAGAKYDGTNAIQFWGSPLNGYYVFSKSKHVKEAVALAEFCAMQDALYFNSQNAPCTLTTGKESEATEPLMKKNLEDYNKAELKLPSLTLYAMDSKVNAEFSSLGSKLLTGDYTAEQFVEDFKNTWAENTWFK